MVSLSSIALFDIISSALFLIPAFFLLRNYRKTNLRDFLIFALIFIFGAIGLVLIAIDPLGETLLLVQLSTFFISCTTLIIFVHALSIKWEKPPVIILLSGIMLFLLSVVPIPFYKLMVFPESGNYWFIELPHTFSGYYPNGAGIQTTDGIILAGTSYNQIWYVFLIYTLLIIIFSYFKVEPVQKTERIILAKRLWILTWSLYLMYAILGLIGLELANLFITLSAVLLAIISIKIPESILISQVQLARASEIYKSVTEQSSDSEINMKSLENYFKLILSAKDETDVDSIDELGHVD